MSEPPARKAPTGQGREVAPAEFRSLFRKASKQHGDERLVADVECRWTGGWRTRRVRDFTFRNFRLNRSRLGNALLPFRVRIERCRFEDGSFEESLFFRTDFVDCVFVDVTIMGRARTEFFNCTFTRCRFERVRQGIVNRSTLVDVEIIDAVRSEHYDHCDVKRLRVSGRFRGKFVECSVRSSDFSAAHFGAAGGFAKGTTLDDVLLPTDPWGFVVLRSDLLAGFTVAAPAMRAEIADQLLQIGRAFQGVTTIGSVEDDYFRDLTPEEQNALLAAFVPYRVENAQLSMSGPLLTPPSSNRP